MEVSNYVVFVRISFPDRIKESSFHTAGLTIGGLALLKYLRFKINAHCGAHRDDV